MSEREDKKRDKIIKFRASDDDRQLLSVVAMTLGKNQATTFRILLFLAAEALGWARDEEGNLMLSPSRPRLTPDDATQALANYDWRGELSRYIPISKNPEKLRYFLTARLDDTHREILTGLQELLGLTESEIARMGLRALRDLHKDKFSIEDQN